MDNYLLLTLGHNSSAIFVDNTGKKPEITGYEQERLSRIKGDSQFPIDAINEIERNVGFDKMKGCKVYVSHWFNFGVAIPNKYISKLDIQKIKSYNPIDVVFCDESFTHHDAHAYSAYSFFEYHQEMPNHAPLYCIVADGFGNDQEVLSIYVCRNGKKELIHRAYGFNASLGLMYQYATSFTGMKENQDEYKFLGYESHIDECCNEGQMIFLEEHIKNIVKNMTALLLNNTKKVCTFDKVIDYEALDRTKRYWYSVFNSIVTNHDSHSYESKCMIAYVIQQSIERIIGVILKEFEITNVCLAGGCFYNVKLNNYIMNSIPGLISIMPLAGDQGAAVGMVVAKEDFKFPFDTLCWGKRRLTKLDNFAKNNNKIIICDEQYDAAHIVAKLIANNEIVNLIHGNMEFGPRALCSTSTLMLPTKENTSYNNSMNRRNEVMPCAPVCTEGNARKLFYDAELDKVVGSDRFMICTHEYKRDYSNFYGGVMHRKPMCSLYTGRPQIVNTGSFMYDVLKAVEELTDVKCLVNTSFNAHGRPIVFDTMDIIHNFQFQCDNCYTDKVPYLVIVR